MKRLIISLVLCSFAAFTGFAQTDLQPAAIVKLTKSEPITVKQLKGETEKLVRETLMQNLRRPPTAAEINTAIQALTAAEKRQVLDVMINEKLAIQAAERDKVTISDNEVNQQLQQLRSQMAQAAGRQPTDAEFALAIKNETGLELSAFRDQIRRQGLVQKYLMSKKQNVLEGVKTPTEADILTFYNNAKAQFVRPETIRFSMIQVPFGANAADRTKARDLANRLFREIGASPTKFDEAVLRGQAPNSGYQAGDAGFMPRQTETQQVMGMEFINTAFSLKQGEVSKLIEGAQGFQIIKVTETYDQKFLALDDMVQPGTRITVRDYITQGLSQQYQQEILERATQELVTELRRGNPFQVFENNLNW
ncbi:hypothetical protein AGMMS49587_14590 [Spirochaetia bacterium]|nr:hypothetical protein AGMMS49587_14590 [Spirochaetia bacterium]